MSATLPYEDLGSAVKPTAVSATDPVPFWAESPESWDTVVIAGIRLPGVCTIKGRVSRRLDKKNQAGTHGSTISYTGDDNAEFSITVRMWTPDHLKAYVQLITDLSAFVATSANSSGVGLTQAQVAQIAKVNKSQQQSTGSKFPSVPIDLVHPVLTLHKIRAAHLLEYSFPEAKGDATQGIYEATLKFVEHVAGTRGLVTTPTGAYVSKLRTGGYGKGAAVNQMNQPKPSTTNAGKTT